MSGLPIDVLGGRQSGPTTLAFGILLPWITPGNGQTVEVLAIHEKDQYLQDVPAVAVPLAHSIDPTYGDLWSGEVDVSLPTTLPLQARWGTPGRYVYRLAVNDPNQGRINWVIDPYAREFGVGKQSAVTLDAVPFPWSATEAAWRVPDLFDLVMYEINLAEFHIDVAGVIERLDYLADLGVNCLSIMPVTNVASEIDWGYLPAGYLGVDERFGGADAFRSLVDAAHARGIAVIVDAVYGHASRGLFGYQYLYDRLRYDQNPFMGPFAQDLFAAQGASIDFTHPLVQDYFVAVNRLWLEDFHVDGFRYDCIPNYWDGPLGVGYAKLAYDTNRLVTAELQAGRMSRFGVASASRLIQCAEQLEDPIGVLWQSDSRATWQNTTRDAGLAVAAGAPGAIDRFGRALGLAGFPTQVPMNGALTDKTALQYLENHDHPRLLTSFGTLQSDEGGNPLFEVGDRSRWFKLQPYLIGLLAAKGIPLLFQGQELAEDFTLPGNGLGRIALLRPVNWDYFYDDPGRSLVTLVRKLLTLRGTRPELRRGEHWYYADDILQNHGVMIFHRIQGPQASVVAVNFTDTTVTVPFSFPLPGQWTEHLGQPAQRDVSGTETLSIPSNYGQLWTTG